MTLLTRPTPGLSLHFCDILWTMWGNVGSVGR